MAHTKQLGSTKLGRESESKRLGVKRQHGQPVRGGEILIRQRGSRYLAGRNVKTGGDDANLDLVDHVFVDGGAKNNVGVGVGRVADDGGGLVDLGHGHVHAAGNVKENAAGALDGDLQ